MREGAPSRVQCVEAQIMDWADDVAYSVHDLEDGIQAGHVPLPALASREERFELVTLVAASYLEAPADDVGAALERLQTLPFWLREFDGSLRAMVALKQMTSELIGRLCGSVVRATREHAPEAGLRRYSGTVVVPAATRAECAVLKAMANRYVMSRERTVRLQRRQREQLTELLHRLAASAPGSLEPWLHAPYQAAGDDAGRLRVVVDQVASLTDTSAPNWYQRWVA
jgi:dGTPase